MIEFVKGMFEEWWFNNRSEINVASVADEEKPRNNLILQTKRRTSNSGVYGWIEMLSITCDP